MVTERPIAMKQRRSLDRLLIDHGAHPLSLRATAGFASRLARSSLRTSEAFRSSLAVHVQHMSSIGA
jgi:hypothetical protein